MSKTIDKSLALLKYGDNEPQQNTPVSANQESVEQEIPKRYPLYIPSNFDIDEHLKEYPFKSEEYPIKLKFHKDYIVYLIHLVANGNYHKKDSNDYYSRIHSNLVQKRVRDYRKYLDYLVNSKVIIEDSQYIVSKHSRGFTFTTKYSTEIKQTHITKKTLIKSIFKFYEFKDKKIVYQPDTLIQVPYLTKWFDSKLKIDFEKAKSCLQELYINDYTTFFETKEYKVLAKQPDFNFLGYLFKVAMMKYNSRLIALTKLHKGQFSPKIDTTAGRLHSVITQIKGDLRQFITYDDQPLVAIDIVNSQPYLSTILLNEDKIHENKIIERIQIFNNKFSNKDYPIMLAKMIRDKSQETDIKSYIDSVSSGEFYEEFGKLLLKNNCIETNSNIPIRNLCKEATFCSLFSPNNLAPHIQAIQSFKNTFPNVFEIFKLIKSGRNHPALACLLQNFEAELILHRASKLIANSHPDIPIFTLHDAIITIPAHVEYVENVMKEVLTHAIGIAPTLKIEHWAA